MIGDSYIGELSIADYDKDFIRYVFDSLDAVGDFDSFWAKIISEAMSIDETTDYSWITEFIESLNSTTIDTTTITTTSLYSEEITVETAFLIALVGLISENIDSDDTISSAMQKLMLIAEYLETQDLPVTLGELANALTEAVEVSDTISRGLFVDTDESLDMNAVESSIMSVLGLVDEDIDVADTSTVTVSVVVQVPETVGFDDLHTYQQVLNFAIEEGIQIGGALRLPTDEYYTWVVNTETHAASVYDNYPFNSLALGDQRYFGMSDEGIFELTGDTDNSTDIEASFLTGMMDLGSELQKGASRMYLGYTSDGSIALKLTTVDGGLKYESWYKLTDRTATSPREARIKLGRGMKALYLQFELANVDGADFSFDNIRLLPIETKRRVK